MSVDRKTPLLDWARRLEAVARSAPAKSHASGCFSDEAGHRRTIDVPLLSWRRKTPSLPVAAPNETDVALWWAVAGAAIDPVQELSRVDGPRSSADRGSLLPMSSAAAIEVWTERELASLHALWWLVRRSANAALRERLTNAVAWHIEHIQPDNATAHPWAIHVFLAHAITNAEAIDARLYAETQLHNCRVSLGYPDALSVEILLDSAEALRSLATDEVY